LGSTSPNTNSARVQPTHGLIRGPSKLKILSIHNPQNPNLLILFEYLREKYYSLRTLILDGFSVLDLSNRERFFGFWILSLSNLSKTFGALKRESKALVLECFSLLSLLSNIVLSLLL
jgi:hypothetical protein